MHKLNTFMVGRNSVDGSQPNTVAEVPITEHLSCLVILYLVWKQEMYTKYINLHRSFNVDKLALVLKHKQLKWLLCR